MKTPPGEKVMGSGEYRPDRATRITGLDSLSLPDLSVIERERRGLWFLSLLLLLLLTSAMIVLSLEDGARFGWLTASSARVGLGALVVLFCGISVWRERNLRRLTSRLLDEKVLTAALTNRLTEVGVLLEAGKAVNLGLEIDEVLDTILRCALDLLDGRAGSIMLVDGEDELRTVSSAGSSAATGAHVRFGEGIAGQVALTGEPLLITGNLGWEHYVDRPDAPPPTSALSVPLTHRGRLLGVLNVNARPERQLTEHDLRALSLFAEHAATAIANAQLYETQRLLASQNAFQSMHDVLTRLPNRALFLDRLQNALARRRSNGRRIAVIMLDLDDFRRINDSLGPSAGDQTLIAVAERMSESVRSGDTVSRLGGDEFAVLLEDVSDGNEALETADRLVTSLSQPLAVGGSELELSACIGVAADSQSPRPNAQELVRAAQTAMHLAKESGRGQVRLFEPTMHEDAVRRLDLETQLRRAIERNELTVYFQPIFALARSEVVAVEALVRWRHPEHGLLPAGAFVPVAERTGLLERIDHWVLREACRAAAGVNRNGRSSAPLAMHVNVPPDRLQREGLLEIVVAALEESGLAPGSLVVEITEAVALPSSDVAMLTLQRLRELGVRVAIDDFGTGYSSLSYLRRFPVDVVKVDRIFIDGLNRDPGAAALLQAIVRLGAGLTFEVVAEGIEHESQVASLLQLGCAFGQGFHLSHPLPSDELHALLARGVL